jgi:hypothetical protein
MKNTVFNTTATAAVFIWINTSNGMTYISTNAKTDYDDGHYDDWIYNRLVKYERQMQVGDKRIPETLLSDAQNGQSFRTIVISFNDKWAALDYSNYLFKYLQNHNLTYCKLLKQFKSCTDEIRNEEPLENIFDNLKVTIKDDADGYFVEQLIYDTTPYEGFIDSRDREIDINHNAYTEMQAKKEEAKKPVKVKACPFCHMATSLTGVCDNYRCDHEGEKVL